VLAAARFIGGRRGLSLSARFGGYGTVGRDAAIADADQAVVICQIESGPAVEAVEQIAAVPGLGGLLIGRSDLALSMGLAGPRHPLVAAAVTRTVAAAKANNLAVIIACGSDAEVAEFAAQGASGFIVGSDQSLLRQAGGKLRGLLNEAFKL